MRSAAKLVSFFFIASHQHMVKDEIKPYLSLFVSQVNGDTVTLHLEVKSTRERATPDKAVWGYSVTIAADQVI